jgi:adenosylcobinamide kinase/adenosylcobinamide-phosphate guanylyltransferase
VLVGGGLQSGKTHYACALAATHGARLGFLGTSQPLDEEAQAHIHQLQAERYPQFVVLDSPLDPAGVIAAHGDSFDAIVLDCVVTWLGNLVAEGAAGLTPAIEQLAAAAAATTAQVIAITSEIGQGLPHTDPATRHFAAAVQEANQLLSTAAGSVFWMAFGVPVRIK